MEQESKEAWEPKSFVSGPGKTMDFYRDCGTQVRSAANLRTSTYFLRVNYGPDSCRINWQDPCVWARLSGEPYILSLEIEPSKLDILPFVRFAVCLMLRLVSSRSVEPDYKTDDVLTAPESLCSSPVHRGPSGISASSWSKRFQTGVMHCFIHLLIHILQST